MVRENSPADESHLGSDLAKRVEVLVARIGWISLKALLMETTADQGGFST